MKESYKELRERTQEEFNKLPIYFAFDDEQYKRLLSKLDLTDEEARNGALMSLPSGGIIRSSDKDLVIGTFKRFWDAKNEAIKEDLTGNGFIYQMFLYELQNHEFIITQDTDETLTALGISEEDLKANAALSFGLCKAIAKIQEESDL